MSKSYPISVLQSEIVERYIRCNNLSAKACKKSKYKPYSRVYNCDPKYRVGEEMVYIASLRWPCGGGYLVLRYNTINRTSRLSTTTNIKKTKKAALSDAIS